MKTIAELCERSHVRVRFEKDQFMDGEPYRVHLYRRPNHACGPLVLETSAVGADPKPEDILQALLDLARFGELTFVDYCVDLDLSDDSIKAHTAWTHCRSVYAELRAFLGEKFYVEFSSAVLTARAAMFQSATQPATGENQVKYYVIDEVQLRRLETLQKRLHTEDRMNGDEMRDAGHTLESVVRICRELEIPEEGK